MPPEAARYVPVAETETNDWGCPINLKPPWVVNEAGQHLGESHVEDALNTQDLAGRITKEFFTWIETQGLGPKS